MLRFICKSKIHRATVSDKNINYEGSITIDKKLLLLSNIFPYEKVQVVNINNGKRFETYVIEGKEDSGEICMNGAAARLVELGDKIIIIAYGMLSDEETKSFLPSVVLVDEKNQPIAK
ncbi:MAG: aspartate 1-decarboxylase [Candidatus Margulisiibacteriota bacterium]|nr:MAG: aspartate 1-decarboxylase [Candidatus Margulisbacteria bacterium GWD2_39_127]OGI01040.1 MAG: aspartate 1-decarboxylase [Candidatus Margulisbacteria bacterium GWF2_38_17]OGI09569.1 MAG: aspartate 1-decarboxylase [Candidatus Margulisbacteria bacterium GWE2_39_32]PZM82014.1 MAG: aspartate 1-decarboxylase [Candidatus Margulisiibacteriota bacterium]HCY35865.1 aspartate 1-decarboxylase [Candidatus Margulisiibacteriota bacterium]